MTFEGRRWKCFTSLLLLALVSWVFGVVVKEIGTLRNGCGFSHMDI